MKKLGFTAVMVGGMATAVLGLAGPASAGVDHHAWLDQVHHHATAPQVDTTVHQSR